MTTTTGSTSVILTNGARVAFDYAHTSGAPGDRWTPADPGQVEILALFAENGRKLSTQAQARLMADETNRDRVTQAAYDAASETAEDVDLDAASYTLRETPP